MSDLLGMSFDMSTSPSITLKAQVRPVSNTAPADLPYGWGMGWYPGDEQGAVVIKDPTSVGDNAMSQVLRDWERFRSCTFVCHLRGAAQRITQHDTHPFIRSHAGRQWLIAHNGSLHGQWASALPLDPDLAYEPIGRTDTEHVFCWLLGRLTAGNWRTLADCGWTRIYSWLQEVNALGECNILLTDGIDLVVYHDRMDFNALHWVRLTPPDLQGRQENETVVVSLDGVLDRNRTGVLFATSPLSGHPWVQMSPGQMLVARRGAIIWDSLAVWAWEPPDPQVVGGSAEFESPGTEASMPNVNGPLPSGQSETDATPVMDSPAAAASGVPHGERAPETSTLQGSPASGPMQQSLAKPSAGGLPLPGSPVSGAYSPPVRKPEPVTARVLSVLHETVYRYDSPVDFSTHLLRLRPVHDRRQVIQSYRLSISADGLLREYEDVFGNSALQLEISEPYRELTIRTESKVRVESQPTLNLRAPHKRDQIPLVWMPWQRQMMLPYLLPQELAESQLREILEYAMSFVERNDFELLETLLDMNRTIFQDFSYISGSTTVSTTPYEVFTSRRGVCQDFANLLICMARLLNVPARYRAGYIYTGGNYENRMQSDASHAWAELYLPWVGWHGFDPTNGCLVAADHVRVACGRNFQDATPTSGTIFRGGGNEILSVEVVVDEV